MPREEITVDRGRCQGTAGRVRSMSGRMLVVVGDEVTKSKNSLDLC